jgi:demethylmacrocin O-methyltransferase
MSTDPALIENVLRAAGLPADEMSARVAEIGSNAVAAVLVAEVASRAALLNTAAHKFVVQCDLGFGGDRLGFLLTVGDGRPRAEEGWDAEAHATIRQDLLDLLRELFGPAGPHGATREIQVAHYVDGEYSPAIAAGIWPIAQAMSQSPKDLTELAARFGSDKWGGHWYTPHYARHFEPYRELPVKVLELGIGGYSAVDRGGESLRMWKHYFRRGLIYGLDIFPKSGIDQSRITTIQGDQGDEQFLDDLGRRLGPFDIVIDDGSHISHHVIASFNALLPHVRAGGLYVIEDLLTAYWPKWGGATDPTAQYRSIELIKDLIDGLHHREELRAADHPPSATEQTVTGLHVYHNLAIIEKGINTEQGAPEWLKHWDHTGAYPPG